MYRKYIFMHSQRSPVRIWKKRQENLIQDNVVERIYPMLKIPDLGRADFHRARATIAPASNRFRMPTVGHNRKRFLLRDELVSVPQGRILPLEEPRRVRHAGGNACGCGQLPAF